MSRVALGARGDADVFQVPPDGIRVAVDVRVDERMGHRAVQAGARLLGNPAAEHLEASGDAVADVDVKALRAHRPMTRIERIDRRAFADDLPRRAELPESLGERVLEVRLGQHAVP